MKLSEITEYLESIAPIKFQENYDNSGLLVGEPNMTCTGAIIALDMTEEVILEAIQKNCNVVIAHHPIIFSGIKKFDNRRYVDRAVITAIKNDIALYAIHTNLDNVLRSGVNGKIAQKLGLQNVVALRPHSAAPFEPEFVLGSGAVGELTGPLSEERFLDYVKERMNIKMIRHTMLLNKKIKKVAVCGGAGSFLLPKAIEVQSDVFITSDFKYHEFFDANKEIIVLDIGHYESEYFTIELLLELISKKFPKFAAHYTNVVTNPVYYY